jgi:methylamine---glutamate N-methyltransferase subunit C
VPGGGGDPGARAVTQRLDPETGARWMTNYLKALTMELTALARACGKSDVHNLEPDDLVALTVEAAAMAQVPLAGTNWIPGQPAR